MFGDMKEAVRTVRKKRRDSNEGGHVTASENRASKGATSLNALNVYISRVNAYFDEYFIYELLPANNLPT